MDSIEKYVDQLARTGADAARPADPAPPAAAAAVVSAVLPVVDTALESGAAVNINLPALDAAGFLTPLNTNTVIAEEYRAIKRPLLRNAFGGHGNETGNANLIMVTSSMPGEGKSFTSLNLAMSIAMEKDYTVLLVEADVVKPAIGRMLGMPVSEPGLVDYLASDTIPLSSLMMRTSVPKLSILRAGTMHPSSYELLASQNMRRLTQELAHRYSDRVVIFDCPPLLMSSDAVLLSTLVGQVVMVVEAGDTPQSSVKEALRLLEKNKTVGIVLNKSRGGSNEVYGYEGYGSYANPNDARK